MEAHGSPVAQAGADGSPGSCPTPSAEPLMQKAGVDRLDALYSAIDIVRRGGTISLSGVYGGMADPMPMMTLFDKQIQLRMGQANVKQLGRRHPAAAHRRRPAGRRRLRHPPAAARARRPHAYEIFQKKQDGAVKIVLQP